MTNKQKLKEDQIIAYCLQNLNTQEENKILNYLIVNNLIDNYNLTPPLDTSTPKTENFVKYNVAKYLRTQNYIVPQIAYNKTHGTDIIAIHKKTKKVLKIEAKGASYHNADGVNLNTAIGEILRDLDPNIDYMLAFPSDTGLQKWYLKDYKLFKSIMSPYGLDKIFTVYDDGNVIIEG